MVSTISPLQLADVLSSPNAQFIDVRDHDEWLAGHVDGARSVPLDELRANPEHELSRDGAIVFICAKGARSLTAAKLVDRLGFTKVYSVDGGTLAAARAGIQLITQRAAA